MKILDAHRMTPAFFQTMDWQQEIEQAAAGIASTVNRTPLVEARFAPGVWLKCEHEQVTGSFKVRGATWAMHSLDASVRSRGVVTASSGNHGAGVAFAAAQLGCHATVFVPNHADDKKVAGIRELGATVERFGDDCMDTELHARALAAETGRAYLSPYNDPTIIVGQGTIGKELTEQATALDAVFVSVGGGGLISGIGSWLKATSPQTRVIACSPVQSPAMHACIEAGEIIEVECGETLSGATAGGVEPGAVTFERCQRVVDDWLLVTEEEIGHAVHRLHLDHEMSVEGAAGVALAGWHQQREMLRDRNIGVVLCGGNIDVKTMNEILAEEPGW